MAKAKSEKVVFYGTGRRKKAIARVRVVDGKGNITINGKNIDEYFGMETLKVIVKQPLVLTNTLEKFDVIATVVGGGFTGQTGAIRLGITRALLEYDKPNEGNEGCFRSVLKRAGFVTRDSRSKERKKPGLKAARRAPQFSKR